jgi:hypothetical protein
MNMPIFFKINRVKMLLYQEKQEAFSGEASFLPGKTVYSSIAQIG